MFYIRIDIPKNILIGLPKYPENCIFKKIMKETYTKISLLK